MKLDNLNYTITRNNKMIPLVMIGIGVISIVIGFMADPTREWANLLLSNFYFMALSLASVFFLAVQYVAEVGWSAGIKRVLMAIGMYVPIAGVIMLIIFIFGHHNLYDWTHHYFYEEFLADGVTPNPQKDDILIGKSGYLNVPFFVTRMILYFLIWSGFAYLLRKESIKSDLEKGLSHYNKSSLYSAIFLVLFAVTSSMSAWDFIMSIDAHWFSTLFGWYTFASLFVSGLSFITLLIIYLKRKGYMTHINKNHLHDLGKFMFAFSIFWTYLWFSQFMLIWYANLPEEVVYFMKRQEHYLPLFIGNFTINFFFPFLILMMRKSKRNMNTLVVVACIILFGHWIDMFLMIMPGTVGEHWHIGIPEIGTTIGFAGLFLWRVFAMLAKAPLVPKNHPMMEESLHHHI